MALDPDDPNVQIAKVQPGQTVAAAVGQDVARTLRQSVPRQSIGGADFGLTVETGPAQAGESDDCPHCGAENAMVETGGFGDTVRLCMRCKGKG